MADSNEPVSLGDAAAAGMAQFGDPSTGDDQGMLDGMDFTKVRFVGMAMDSIENDIKIGDEMAFLVRARCVGTGEEAMRDGHVRHYVKMDVSSVLVHEGEGLAAADD